MNNIETIKLALEALESCGWNDGYAGKTQYFHDELVDKAIATLRQAIDQTQQAEPVAWMNGWGNVFKNPDDAERGQTLTPLYTTPPQRKPDPVIDKSAAIRIATALGWTPPRQPLTDEEINKKWSEALADTEGQTYLPLTEFARAIEAAHGIKGEA